MTIDELERAAMKAARMNAPSPPYDLLDAHLYLALYSLYATHYAGQLTREQAGPMKRKLVSQYNQQKSSYNFDMKLRQSAVHLWRDTEAAGNAYARERTLDNADRLWAAVLNLPEGSRPKTYGREETGISGGDKNGQA